MEELELDVRQYTPVELRAFFGLDPVKSYTSTDIEARAYAIREQLLTANCIKKGAMRQFVSFMASATTVLIDSMKSPQPTYESDGQSSGQSKTVLPALPYIAPNEFYVKTQTQLLAVDTRFRPNAYSTSASNFTISLPVKVSNLASLELVSFEMSTLSFPNIYRAIRNHYFLLRLILCGGCVCEYIVSLPDGHYASPDAFVSAINQAIHNCSGIYPTPNPAPIPIPTDCGEYNDDNDDSEEVSRAQDVDPVHTVFASYQESTGKIALEATHPDILAMDLDFSTDEQGESNEVHAGAYYTRLGRVLGFTRRKYNGVIPGMGGGVSVPIRHEGETRLDPYLCVRYFYLEVADFQGQYASTFVNTSLVGNSLPASVLGKIVLSEEPDPRWNHRVQTRVHFVSEPRTYLGPTELGRLQVRILDAYGHVMEMENTDYSFTLRMRFMYDSALHKAPQP
jgi:hypothetical protein